MTSVFLCVSTINKKKMQFLQITNKFLEFGMFFLIPNNESVHEALEWTYLFMMKYLSNNHFIKSACI